MPETLPRRHVALRPARIQAHGRALRFGHRRHPLSRARAPLQNRVDPFGALQATPHRGLFFGNRGGRFHRDDRTLGPARWKSRQWIACLCAFKGRRKEVFGPRYTDLFFLDEPTALAAGHRPCFECRRAHALAYVAALGEGHLKAGAIDRRLDAERRNGRAKRMHDLPIDDLPDGAMFADGETVFAARGATVLHWSFAGYTERLARPRNRRVAVLTPPTSLFVLAHGYAPAWHPSAL